MVLIIADRDGTNVRELDDFDMDCAFGSDENRIQVSCPLELAPIEGQIVYADRSEVGGIIDEVEVDVSDGFSSVVVKGRTWHGILAAKRLLPDAGMSHLEVSGTVSGIIGSLLKRMGIDGMFKAGSCETEIESWRFDRFTDAYEGIRKMLRANNLKLALRHDGDHVVVDAAPIADLTDKVDSDMIDFVMTNVHRCTNHLVCAGRGELEDREVIHFYADSDGNVSHTQTLFGLDEIAALYDYSNADNLEEDGRKKLEEYQGQGTVEVETDGSFDADVDDVISAFDSNTGTRVSAHIVKKIVKAEHGHETVSYEVGTATTTQNSTSSGGGGG